MNSEAAVQLEGSWVQAPEELRGFGVLSLGGRSRVQVIELGCRAKKGFMANNG